MLNALIKAGSIACLLGGFAFIVPAYAAEDMETQAVEEDMRPDEVQSDSMQESKPAPAAPKEGAKEGAMDAEEKAMEEDMGQGQ
ncbi:MAG: hypothetical protein FJX44_07470 [Alphaproteobacteria bacterium]|nr:hypothetical protein [Alphaproteobacteria bacterium]